MKPYILAIDQSTQGTKAMLLDREGKLVLRRDLPHKQHINEKGWVGHDLAEIRDNIFRVTANVIRDSGIPKEAVAAVAVTNQRETVGLWDRATGEPVCEAVVWQCNRATRLCQRLATPEIEEMVWKKTGLKFSPFFSAPKVAWILENIPGARERADRGELCMGTMDSWTIWQLTGGKVHKTDTSNASRTQLFNINTMSWDAELCDLFGIPAGCLPQVQDSDGFYGETDLGGFLPQPVPIHADLGDSHGVMFSHGCIHPGDAMCGYGTGSCVLVNAGETPVYPDCGVNTTVAWTSKGTTYYALEGVVNYSGAVVTWLKDNANLIASARETSDLAWSANPADKTYMVPAFTGLGAPHWRPEATAAYVGMTRLTGRAELVRAALESVAYQIGDLVFPSLKAIGAPGRELRVAGGPSRNEYMMQFQSDILACPVVIPENEELSGMGAAYMAGIALGVYDYDTLIRQQKTTVFTPKMSGEERAERLAGWAHALDVVLRY